MSIRIDRRRLFYCLSLLWAGLFTRVVTADEASAPATFQPGAVWLDTDGQPIQAHGGGILVDPASGTFFWFGENKNGVTQGDQLKELIGVSCYSSHDLLRWKNEGVVLSAVKNDPTHELSPDRIAERPHVVFNAKTKKYVMWLHIDTRDYKKASTGVAVADAPTGPYRYVRSVRPDGAESRDMTVFQDDDGKAYLIFASEGNKTMHVVPLSDDYLEPVGPTSRVLIEKTREAPAMFKRQGKYYLITSGCSGWAPNAASYAVGEAPTGPFEWKENPCRGPGAGTTFGAQSTCVLPVPGRPDAFLFMADIWNPHNLGSSRYVWLPIRFEGDAMTIPWHDSWDLSLFDRSEKGPAEHRP